jgi:hypothetical protein
VVRLEVNAEHFFHIAGVGADEQELGALDVEEGGIID